MSIAASLSKRERQFLMHGISLGLALGAGIASHAANNGDSAVVIGRWLEIMAEDRALVGRIFEKAVTDKVPLNGDLARAKFMDFVRVLVECVPQALDRITKERS